MATTPGLIAPGVLPAQTILDLCGLAGNELEESEDTGPVQPCARKNVRSASYDLRLGTRFHASGSHSEAEQHSVSGLAVRKLKKDEDEHIVIPPNQVVVVSSLEKVCLGPEMIGHLTLKQDILLQGLIMASQSQIDAGYRGWIYALFYNLTDSPVTLSLGQSILRFELVQLPAPTDQPYDGDYQERSLSESLKRPIGSSLDGLRRSIEKEKERTNRTRYAGVVVALIAALLPFVSGFVGKVFDTSEQVASLEGQISPTREASRIQTNGIKALNSRLTKLECQLQRSEGQQPDRERC